MAADTGKGSVRAPLLRKVDSTSGDLFTLALLVHPELRAWGLIKEAFRLISRHFNLFRLPFFFLTLDLCLTLAFQIWQLAHAHSLGIAMASLQAAKAAQMHEYYSSLVAWSFAFPLANVLLLGLAETAFDRAVVTAYHKEVYGEAPSVEQKSCNSLILASLRAISTNFLVVISASAIGVLILLVGYISFELLIKALLGYSDDLVVPVMVVSFILFLLFDIYWYVLFIVATPASVVTNKWGFQAMASSLNLTAGQRKLGFILILVAVVLSLMNLAASLGIKTVFNTDAHNIPTFVRISIFFVFDAWVFFLQAFWCIVRIVLYLQLRANHKLPVEHLDA